MYTKIYNSLTKCQLKRANRNRLLVLFGVLAFSALTSAALELVEKTVAIVNNDPIFLSDLKQLEHRLSKAAMVDDLLLFETTPEFLKKDPKAQLQFLVNERIVDSEVKRHNLSITMDRVNQEISEIAKRNNINKEELIKTIQAQGIAVAEYQAFMKQRIERQSVVEQEVTSRIRLSDEDILAFYTNESGKTFNKTLEYSLAHIFFSPLKGSPKEALERAQAVLVKIRDGKNFDDLLAKSTEEESPSLNGFLGTFKSGEFSPEMEKAVRDLDTGGISEIVKARSGYHIIKLISKKSVADPEFEKHKEKYRSLLFEKVFKRQFKAWIDLKREEASIKLN